MTDLFEPTSTPTAALDAGQRAAVEHGDGPCLVLAGPGSGKTRVIVERFLRLLGEEPAESQLVLTYTVKAAAEMRARAEEVAGPFDGEAPLTNYHSFARRVLRDWGWLIGVPPAFRIADAAERWLHLEAVLAGLRPPLLWNPLRPQQLVDSLLRLIETAKQELVTPDAYAAWAARDATDPVDAALLERHRQCAAVYRALDERYRRHAVLDHDDCILLAERLLREHPAAAHATCARIAHVMVDEYQDTNFAQARLVETLVSRHHNLLVVADDDQSIYKFRGASRANLDRFARVYAGHPTIVLRRNYRSTEPIVAASAAIIAAAPAESRIEKNLTATRGAGEDVELWEAPDERSEAAAVAAECRRLMEAGVRGPSIGLLFRRHADMAPVTRALQEAGVPYQVRGGRGFFVQPEVKDLMALLAVIAEPADSQALLRCLHLPAWQVSPAGRVALVAACRDHDAPLCDLVRAPGAVDLDATDGAAAGAAVEAVTGLHAASLHEDAREVFQEALEASGFLGLLDRTREIERMQMGANLNKFGELLEGFADWSDDRRLTTALRYLTVLRESGAVDDLAAVEPAAGGVDLLTAHAAKGLEWPVVFVGSCVAGRWPGRAGVSGSLALPDDLVPEPAPPGDTTLEEERRLFYVAVTRARDRLVLTRAARYARSTGEERLTPFLAPLVPAGPLRTRAVGPAASGPCRRPSLRREQAPAGPLTVSVADLRAFRDCPRRYEYRCRYHMPVLPSPRGWYGELVHAVLHSAAAMRGAGNALDGDAVAALWLRAWEASRGPKGAHAELRAYGEEQLRRYVATPAWTAAAIDSTEDAFTLALDHAAVRGRFDRVDLPAGERPTVVDYKTGVPRDAAAAARDLQVRAYAVALSQRRRTDEVAVELHHLQTAEVARALFGEPELERSFRFLSATARDLANSVADRLFPPRPSAWQCGRCEYRTICAEGRRASA